MDRTARLKSFMEKGKTINVTYGICRVGGKVSEIDDEEVIITSTVKVLPLLEEIDYHHVQIAKITVISEQRSIPKKGKGKENPKRQVLGAKGERLELLRQQGTIINVAIGDRLMRGRIYQTDGTEVVIAETITTLASKEEVYLHYVQTTDIIGTSEKRKIPRKNPKRAREPVAEILGKVT